MSRTQTMQDSANAESVSHVMTVREAEKAVVVARRRKKRARHGGKIDAAVHLKDAVNAALYAHWAASLRSGGPSAKPSDA